GDVDYGEIRGEAPARHWEPLLELIAEIVHTPSLVYEDVEVERRGTLGQILARAEAPLPAAFDGLMADLYRAHPYAWPTIGHQESLRRVLPIAVREHHAAMYHSGNVLLAVSGGVPPARFLPRVERLFGRLRRWPSRPAESRPAIAPTGGRRAIE